ncbi:MAG: fatty acid desaturase [Thermogemmata sp.]|nr:fatty acid desaturase [Thermogemmata sp.]
MSSHTMPATPEKVKALASSEKKAIPAADITTPAPAPCMATAEEKTMTSVAAPQLSDPDFKQRLQELRQTDNWTNWYYLVRTWVYLAVVIGGAIWFFEQRAEWGLSWGWNVPVAVLAIILVGAGQHQLTGLAHEGSHYILFRNRYLNDWVSDLFCMFPIFASLYHYRLQHLAHHQFVNDPERDPDVAQLRASGHWLPFPLSKRQALWALLRQLWPPRLIRFMRVRAQFNATGTDKSPYLLPGHKPSKGAVRVGVIYLLLLVGALAGLYWTGAPLALYLAVPLGLWLAVCFIFWKLPEQQFHRSRLRPVIHPRYTSMARVGVITIMLTTVTAATQATDRPFVGYFLLLWVVPLFTSFAFFMILRQIVQHGNGGRGWINNTRSFFVAPAIRFAVFPMGQDYHLPHHMYCTVPHYRLRQLHELLMQYPEYRAEALEVHGYFFSPERPQVHPTVLDVLGPDYAPRSREVHIDEEILALDAFDDREAIAQEAERSRKALAN